jgi:membrane protein implicated in regulation of membrane protease activity
MKENKMRVVLAMLLMLSGAAFVIPHARACQPVGGISHPTDAFGLWSLYLGLVSILMFATVTTAIWTKRVKRGKEKQQTHFN